MSEMTTEDLAFIDRNEIASGSLSEEEEVYKENIIDHYKNPHHKHAMEGYIIRHSELNPLCGDQLTVFLKIDGMEVADISWDGKGCAISQASMSLLSDRVVHMSISQVKGLSKEDIFAMLGIPISFVRTKCALLSLKTVQNGIAAYEGEKR